jgi:hypothetical protein
MALASAKESVRRLWSRRWLRRVSYTLVGGAALVGGATWFLDRPMVYQWLVRKGDVALQRETGLSLTVGDVEFHPLLGTLTLRNVTIGGDLLTLARLDIQADPGSLFTHRPHFLALRLDQPHLRITAANLAQIHLKERPPRQGPLPQVILDQLSVTGGQLEIPTAFSGLPAGWFHFEATGTGAGPNRMRLSLSMPKLAVQGPKGWEKGRLDLKGEASESLLLLQECYLRVGGSQIRLSGRFDPKTQIKPQAMNARLTGVLELEQVLRWAGSGPHVPVAGDVDFTATLQGSLAHPRWTLAAEGQDLRVASPEARRGDVALQAQGDLTHIRLEHLGWRSPQGSLDADGLWSKNHPAHLHLQAEQWNLDVLSRFLRVPELQGTRASLTAECESPARPAAFGDLNRWTATGKIAFTQDGQAAGGLNLNLHAGALAVNDLGLDLRDISLQGSATAQLSATRIGNLKVQGTVQVDAARVADALRAWKVTDLDMSGQAQAQAQLQWTLRKGLQLDGSVAVETPRWHGATADHLTAGVTIQGTDLRVHDIELEKGAGRGSGELWLTWGKVPKGQKRVDMCYTAFRLPAAEGLKAADLGDLPIVGTGSGWVRIHGPYHHLLMEGEVQAEDSTVYGIQIPAASADFNMDLDTLLLQLKDVRIAGGPDLLGLPPGGPEGALALQGMADMDLTGWTWRVDLAGRFDSQLLGLPGPHIQSQVSARLLGPITAPFGPLDLPEGHLAFQNGRIFLFGRSVEGLTGELSLERGHLASRLATAGLPNPILTFEARNHGTGLTGHAGLRIAPDTAPTGPLARSLTEDLLENMQADLSASGTWTPSHGLQWQGRIQQLEGLFSAFELHQHGPSDLTGTAHDAHLDLALEGGERNGDPSRSPAAGIRIVGNVPFSADAPVALTAKGTADLGHLKAILDRIMEVDEYSLLSELKVKGDSTFDLLLHGSYRDPLLDGTLRLEGGQMNLQGYQGMEDLHAEFLLKDHTLSISGQTPLSGTLAHGQLRATGGLTWRLGGVDSYDFDASLTNFQLRDVPEGLDLQGSLQATLKGNEDGGLLQGRLQADHLDYQAEVKLSDLILRSALSDSGGLTGLDPEDPLDRIRLSLDLDLRNPWSFDTNLLKLEGKTEGRFLVRGTLAHPVPQGTLVFLPGGRLTNIFPAGDMVVDQGSLDFKGESDRIDPLISMRGSVTSIPGYTVNLDIHGTLSNLNIVPSSTPTLRQDEIVAILINPGNAANVGTGATTNSQSQLTSGLASASAGLLSTLAFAPFQDQLRRTLGLDRVNVAVRSSSLGTTETDVTLGKSINLFGQRSAFVVSHQKSAELNITSGQVEWRFGGFILQLGVSQSGQSGINPSGEIRHTWSPK